MSRKKPQFALVAFVMKSRLCMNKCRPTVDSYTVRKAVFRVAFRNSRSMQKRVKKISYKFPRNVPDHRKVTLVLLVTVKNNLNSERRAPRGHVNTTFKIFLMRTRLTIIAHPRNDTL